MKNIINIEQDKVIFIDAETLEEVKKELENIKTMKAKAIGENIVIKLQLYKVKYNVADYNLPPFKIVELNRDDAEFLLNAIIPDYKDNQICKKILDKFKNTKILYTLVFNSKELKPLPIEKN